MSALRHTQTFCKALSAFVIGTCALLQAQHAKAGAFCTMSKNAAQVSRTAYNSSASDKRKYLPSGFTYRKSWSSSTYKGGDHAYMSESYIYIQQVSKDPTNKTAKPTFVKKKACHYTFRGLNLSNTEMLDEVKVMKKKVNCSSYNKRGMGSCSKAPYRRYLTLRNNIIAHIKVYIAKGRCDFLVLNGHSMGGAMAVLLAADLYLYNKSVYHNKFVKVYTFGSPKTFEKSSASNWSSKLSITRWAYDDSKGLGDHVPRMPSSSFAHLGRAYKIYRKFRLFKKSQYSYNKQSDQWTPSPKLFGTHAANYYTDALNKGCK